MGLWVLYSLGFGFTVAYVLKKIGENIVSDVQDAVDAVVAQLVKAKAEIVSEIESLEAKVVSGEPVDLTGLKAAAAALDDVVADAPVEEPASEEV